MEGAAQLEVPLKEGGVETLARDAVGGESYALAPHSPVQQSVTG